MQEIETIPFAGGEMEATTGPDGEAYVSIRRMSEDVGLDYSSQARKLKAKAWARVVEMTTRRSDGKQATMLFLAASGIPMWAAGIADGKVKAELRARLRAYQCEAADVLAKHFMPTTNTDLVSSNGSSLAKLEQVQSMTLQAVQVLGEVSVDRYNDETTGKPRPEWGQGHYFGFHVEGQPSPEVHQARALGNALDFYREKLAVIRGNDAA